MRFDAKLNGKMKFNKCWNLMLRGHNKAGAFSTVSKNIKPCEDTNYVKATAVIDCVGSSMATEGM